MVCEHEYMNISPPIIELATALTVPTTWVCQTLVNKKDRNVLNNVDFLLLDRSTVSSQLVLRLHRR